MGPQVSGEMGKEWQGGGLREDKRPRVDQATKELQGFVFVSV